MNPKAQMMFEQFKQKTDHAVLMGSSYCKTHRSKGKKCNDCESEEGCAKMVEIGLEQLHKIADNMGKDEFLRFWRSHAIQ
jgi:primosomal protein N'